MILVALALLGAPAQEELPAYVLGRLDVPPIAEPARPFRLVDLRYALDDTGSAFHRFETRARLGSSIFLGGEAASDRVGFFVDTQRLELGVTERDGEPTLEGSFRAPWFLARLRGERDGEAWRLAGEGSLRLNADLEILLGYEEDRNDARVEPPSLERFIETGESPEPGPPTRVLRSISAGLLYQRGNHLEMRSRFHRTRLRSEAGFDFDRDRVEVDAVWNRAPIELDAELEHERADGSLRRRQTTVGLGGRLALGRHLVARAATRQSWEPGLLRFHEEYRGGVTWFVRDFRFARASAIGERVLELQRRAHELGYNERRVYDVEELRRFRERLGISPARAELEEALEALYVAQVRERNVSQLGFDLTLEQDALTGVETRVYRFLVAVPWPIAAPLARDEDAVDFLRLEAAYRDARYPGGLRGVGRALSVVAFLNRELSLRVTWESFGLRPLDVVRERSRPDRFFVGFDYALGR